VSLPSSHITANAPRFLARWFFLLVFFCDPVVVVIRLPSRHYRLLALLLAATIIEAKFAEPKFAAIIG